MSDMKIMIRSVPRFLYESRDSSGIQKY